MNAASPYPSNDEVRQWAMTKKAGAGMSYRGALSRAAIAGWDREHPDRPYVASEAYHGSTGGYTSHNCRCRPCTTAGSAASMDGRRGRLEEA